MWKLLFGVTVKQARCCSRSDAVENDANGTYCDAKDRTVTPQRQQRNVHRLSSCLWRLQHCGVPESRDRVTVQSVTVSAPWQAECFTLMSNVSSWELRLQLQRRRRLSRCVARSQVKHKRAEQIFVFYSHKTENTAHTVNVQNKPRGTWGISLSHISQSDGWRVLQVFIWNIKWMLNIKLI